MKCFEERFYQNSPGYPAPERLRKGPVAVIECVEEIPCNPCETICHFGAIKVGKPIINLPRLDEKKCKGCGKCIAVCPGLAIFVVDNTFNKREATVSLPYEFLPLPEKGERVNGLNRRGERICSGKVIKIIPPEKNDHTAVITVAVPKECSGEIRNIELAQAKALRLPGSRNL